MNNKSDISKKVYSRVRNMYSAELARAKEEYYQNKTGETEGNVKKLYAVTSNLLRRSKDNSLPQHTSDVSLANDFLRFLQIKLSN